MSEAGGALRIHSFAHPGSLYAFLGNALRYGVVKRLTAIFAESTFLRIEPAKQADADDCRFEIVAVVAAHIDLDGDGELSSAEYLIDEMRNQLRGTGEEHRYLDLISEVQSGKASESAR